MSRVLLSLFLCMPAATLRGQDLVVPARLSLEDALRLTIERNPNLAAARNGVEVAEAGRLDAQVRPNPAFTFESGSYPLFEPSRPSFLNNQEMTLRFDQELELSGRRRLRTQVAETGASAAAARFEDQQRRMEFEVRRAYFAIVLAKADVEVSQAALGEIDRVIDLNRARYEQGEISGGEVRRVQVERLKFVDDLFAAQLALRNARSALLALFNAPDLGLEFDVTEPLGVMAQSGGAVPQVLDAVSLRAQAFSSRPDLLAAQRAIQRADTETALQGWERRQLASSLMTVVTVRHSGDVLDRAEPRFESVPRLRPDPSAGGELFVGEQAAIEGRL